MIKLTGIGNVGADATISSFENKNVINFNVAINESYKDKNGVTVNKATWIKCEYWKDKTTIASYLKKGTQVYIEGTPSIETYTNKEGKEVSILKCRVVSLTLISSKENK